MIYSDLIAFLPELLLAAAVLIFIVYGAFVGDEATGTVAVAGMAVLLVSVGMLIFNAPATGTYFNDLVAQSPLISYGKIAALIAAGLSMFLALPYLRRAGNKKFEFPLLYLFATLGMMILISAQDLMTLYLGLELMSLSLYVIASMRREMVKASEAGLKYFILGALSSGMILYGASIVYGYAGSTSFDGILAAMTASSGQSVGLLIGLSFLISGLAFKVSAVPFHMWTPDVYEGAPAPVTAFFAAAPKVAGMIIFVRLLVEPFAALTSDWQQIIAIIAMASMIWGAFAALTQRNIKRLMAYSSIANMGYALMGLAVGTQAGIRGLLIYMSVYILMTVGTFAVILILRRGDRPVDSIDDLAGLFGQKPGVAAAMTVMMFSLGGIPPLAGFWGKFLVFVAALEVGTPLMVIMAVVGALTSVVAIFYYLRIIKLMLFDEQSDELDAKTPMEWRLVAGFCAVAMIVMTIGFQVMLTWAEIAAASVVAG